MPVRDVHGVPVGRCCSVARVPVGVDVPPTSVVEPAKWLLWLATVAMLAPSRRREPLMPRLRRTLRWVGAVLAVVLLVGAALAFRTVRRPFPQVSGELEIPGLTGEVRVLRDAWGVPHVYASTPEDLFLAQGFVHSQDRFFEMDVRRHVTAGRVAELFGEDEVGTDRFLRTLGWHRVAEQELSLLRDDTREALTAYAAGVNAYLDERGGTSAIALEYAVLGLQLPGYDIEPWDPVDSLAWLKALAWDLRGNMQHEIVRALTAAAGIAADRVDELHPPYPFARHPTILEGGRVHNGRFVPAGAEVRTAGVPVLPAEAAPRLEELSAAISRLPVMLGRGTGHLGSNSWVVSGEHTASGAPLLANDPHLEATLPGIWYQMGLHCTEVTPACPYDVTGFTFSGLPGVVIGHNARIGWGLTNLGADVTDLYVERVDGDRYLVDGQWRDLEIREETIEVAGGEPVTHLVRTTEHGPLLSDASDQLREVADSGATQLERPGDHGGRGTRDAGYAVALRWTALEPGRTADAILMVNRAGNFDEFRRAAEHFAVPSQNLLYADVDGHIGYQAPGRIPVRRGYDGRWPVPGWDAEFDWVDTVPFEELPWALDPADGMIVTANNAVVGPDYVHHLTDEWDRGFRAARIIERLEGALRGAAEDPLTLDDLAAIQGDDLHPMAAVLLPHLRAVGERTEAGEALELLAGWDGHTGEDSAGAAYFQAVWRHLLARLYHDELPEAAWPEGGDDTFEHVRMLLDRPDDRWWDDLTTAGAETRDDVLVAALDDAAAELRERLGDEPDDWAWGDLHTLTLTHQTLGTSGVWPIEGLFNRGPIRTAGGRDIVNATGWTAPEGYEVVAVPSMRMLVDLGDLDASRWVNLTGQSGHAHHRHYWDQTRLWRQNRTLPMPSSVDGVAETAEHELVLRPAP